MVDPAQDEFLADPNHFFRTMANRPEAQCANRLSSGPDLLPE